jgi:centrosomal protein CEP76
MKDLRIENQQKNMNRLNRWSEVIKQKIPHLHRFAILSLFFNYTYEQGIANYIEENCKQFLQSARKNCYILFAIKVFQYPNMILSVRILLGIIYKINEEDFVERSNKIYQTTMQDIEELTNLESYGTLLSKDSNIDNEEIENIENDLDKI